MNADEPKKVSLVGEKSAATNAEVEEHKLSPAERRRQVLREYYRAHIDPVGRLVAELPVDPKATMRSDWRELFQGIYLKRTLTIWGLWVCAYMINNGLISWLPTLYKQVFQLPLQTSLGYGWITSCVGVVAAIICALLIDQVGRKRWYAISFLLATVPLLALSWLGATSATEVLILATATYAILQTITFSLYLYSAEVYPTRLRAIGGGVGSAWLRAGSAIGPILVGFIVGDFGIRYVFAVFAAVALVGGLVTLLFAIETKGRVLEELSP
jgi:putative MFS transporter